MAGSDVKCIFNEVGNSGTTPSDKFSMDGRVRLFNVWVTSTGETDDIRTATIILKTGSDATGDVLLKYDFRFVQWANPSNNISIPGGGIVFPDGLYFDSGNGDTTFINSVSLIYEQG